jgi:hypothetical protein
MLEFNHPNMKKGIMLLVVFVFMAIPIQGKVHDFGWCSFDAPNEFVKINAGADMALVYSLDGSKYEAYSAVRQKPEGTSTDTLNRWIDIVKGGNVAEVNLYEDVEGIQGLTQRATIDCDTLSGVVYVWRPSENTELILYGYVDDSAGITSADKEQVSFNSNTAYITFALF